MSLNDEFISAHRPTTELYFHTIDIYEHLDTLKKYADECEHVTEFGVRDVISTTAFLASKALTVVSYDIEIRPRIPKIQAMCIAENRKWDFHNENVLTSTIEPTDLLFIDTYHSYDHLTQELNLHGNKARKFIILHDTDYFGEKGQDDKIPGLNMAIHEFIGANKAWDIKEVFTNNNGLTVLSR